MCCVIVVGGGISGIVCAIKAKKNNKKVIVLERNDSCLKKLLMTGAGRCNYYNSVFSKKNYDSRDIDIVDSIISDKNLEMVLDFFNDLGVIPNIKNGYYYPYSNQAVTVKNLLLEEASRVGVEIICNCLVNNIIYKDKYVLDTSLGEFSSEKLVLACGGCSYPKTGSTGMGYSFLEKLGHTIIKPLPGLVPLVSDFKYLKELSGIRSLVKIELFENGNYIDCEEGEVQFTKDGISGICTFNLSHYVTRGLDSNKKEEIIINFVPFIDTLITPYMDNYSKKHNDKNLYELLEGFLNTKLIPVILKVCKLDKNSYYQDLSNKEKLLLCSTLRSFKINIIGTKSFDYSQITNGGVKLDEVSISTFESKKSKGLYVIGELLDMNGKCGGYNIVECVLTGLLAGSDL